MESWNVNKMKGCDYSGSKIKKGKKIRIFKKGKKIF
jgi:hypothetical protein